MPARVVWIVVLAASCGRVLLCDSEKQQGVYLLHQEAGRHWLAGEAVYPDQAGWGAFPYGPLTAVFLTPFAVLPQGVGNALWRLCTISLYVTALRRWSRVCLALPADRFGLLALLVLPVTAPTMLNGQIGGLVVSLLLLAAADAVEERWTRSAAFAALAGIIKVYPLAFGLLLAAVFPRRYTFRLALAVLACLALPFCFQRPEYVLDQYAGWFHLLRSADGNPWYVGVANRNVALLFQAVGHPVPFALYRLAELGAATAAAGVCVVLRAQNRPIGTRRKWIARHPPPPLQSISTSCNPCNACNESPPDSLYAANSATASPGYEGTCRRLLVRFAFGLAGCWMTLFGPGTESFTYILVGPTLAALLVADLDRRAGQLYRLMLGGSWALFTAASVCVWIRHGTWILDLGPHPLAGVLLLTCLLIDGRRSSAPRGTSPLCLPQPTAKITPTSFSNSHPREPLPCASAFPAPCEGS
jgi:hypothetical protein